MNAPRIAAALAKRRVLMIAHEFYPCSAIGCHRSGKFCKYLGLYGWEPVVLTARQEFAHGRFDSTLLQQLPGGLCVKRTFYPDLESARKAVRAARDLLRHSHSGNGHAPGGVASMVESRAGFSRWMSIPDWAVFWLPWAVRAGLADARRCDAIYVTGPPHGAVVVGAVLARLSGRRLVIDLRDPWMLDKTLIYPTEWHRRMNRRLERWCFAAAATVICNTRPAMDAYRKLYPEFAPTKFITLPNGFDVTDFPADDNAAEPTRRAEIRMSYVGSLYGGRDPRPLFRAVRRCMDADATGEKRFRIQFWTGTADLARAYARESGVEDLVHVHRLVPHREAIAAMRASDVLLVIGASDTDELHVPGKLFEYVYCRKPVLALVEPGAISDLIDEYQLGLWTHPSDEARLVAHLSTLYAHLRGGEPWPIRPEAFRDFDRRMQAGQLAAILGG